MSELINILVFIVITSLFCNWIYIAMQEWMILNPIKERILKLNLPNWILDPTVNCIYCMASFRSIVIWLLLHPFSIWYLIVIIPSVSALNALIHD